MDTTSLLNLIYAGETDTLELKATIREPQLLSRLIASNPAVRTKVRRNWKQQNLEKSKRKPEKVIKETTTNKNSQ